MKKYLPHISKILLTSVILFGVSGLFFHQTIYASPENPNEPCTYRTENGERIPTNEPCQPLFLENGDINHEATNNSSVAVRATEWVLQRIAEFLLTVTGFLSGLSGIILNGVIFYTVVNVSQNYANIESIGTTWKVVRDIANMGFVFVLLYAAIRQIIGASQDNKKLIVNVVVVAILINFSLFFTKVVIDISNLLALTFYDAIAPTALNIDANWTSQQGLSNAFMQHLNLQSLWQAPDLNAGTIITVGVMGSIMLLITTFVFFAVALLFIIRYVVLILVLVLSPIAFIAFILPSGTGIEKYRKQWVDALTGQAFFAPIYFMLTWVTLNILSGITNSFGTGGPVFDPDNQRAGLGGVISVVGGTIDSGAFVMLINFIIVIVLLIASLIVAKEWSNKAGGGISKLTGWATGAAGGASFGLAGRAGRYTFGAGAEAFKESKMYKRLEAASPNSRAARLALAATDKTRKASFDVRGTRVGGAIAGAVGDIGRAQEGGVEAERKAISEFFERPGTKSYKERQERGRKAQGELDIVAGSTAAPGTPAHTAMEKALSKMSDKEIEAIVESNRKLLESQAFANSISVKQLEAINKSDKFSDTDKDVLKFGVTGRGGRFGRINAAVAGGPAAITAAKSDIQALADAELEMIDPAHLSDETFVAQLKQSQVDAIQKSNKFNARQKTAFKDARERPLKTAFSAGAWPTATDIMQKMGEQSLAKMSAGYNPTVPATLNEMHLNNPHVLGLYTPSILNKMAAQSDLNPTKRTAVRDAIMDSVHGDPTMSAALAALVPAPGRLRVTPTERQTALAGLTPEQRRLVTSAEWLESENGQQIF